MLKDFKAFQLAKEIHHHCKGLKLPHYLEDQILRASSSVALNIAEGSGKRTKPDQRKFYGVALGSLRECEAVIRLQDIENEALYSKVDQLGAILYTLSRSH